MKTKVLFAVRCNPTITINKVTKIKSNGVCYITELLQPKTESKPYSQQRNYKELSSFNIMKIHAEQHPDKDCLIKTASLAGRSRFFIEN